MEHNFTLKASWKGGLGGEGRIATGNLESPFSVPKEMNGPGKGTNPEELLVGAAASCYLITLAAIVEKRKLPVTHIELESQGVVTVEGGLKFSRIVHRPRLTLAVGANEEIIRATTDAAERAEKACMVSQAIRGNVAVSVEAAVIH